MMVQIHCFATQSVFRKRLPQVLAAQTASLLMLDACISIAFTTVLIDSLSVTSDQASWLASIAFICQPIGSLLSGLIIEFVGRKWSMIIVNIPFLVGWLLYHFATSILLLFVTNVILGIGIGFMDAPLMTYTAETCQTELRNILTSVPGVVMHLSSLLVYVINNLTDWRTAAALNAALPVFTVLYVTQMPETPIWLLSRGRYKDAERALCWLRGWVTPDVVREEFHQLIKYNNEANKVRRTTTDTSNAITDDKRHVAYPNCGFEYQASEGDEETQQGTQCSQTQGYTPKPHDSLQGDEGVPYSYLDKCKELLKPPTLRPLALVISYFFLLSLGGMNSIRPFMIHVFQELGMKDAASWIAVGSAGIGILGSMCTVVTVHWLGKRLLSLVSMLGCAVACLLLGTYSYVVLRPGGASQYVMTWLPLSLIIMLSFFNSVMNQIPWMLLSEVFPFRTRGIASGLSGATCYVFMFTASISYLHLEQSLKLHGVFWFFCIINCVGFAFLYWKMPETQGKSLADIEQYFTSLGR